MLNAGVCPIKLCSLTNWCAVMPFFMQKIVGGVGSNFGTVTFYTAADDLLWSYFVFASFRSEVGSASKTANLTVP